MSLNQRLNFYCLLVLLTLSLTCSGLTFGQKNVLQRIDSLEAALELSSAEHTNLGIVSELVPLYFHTNNRQRTLELLEEMERLSASQSNDAIMARAIMLRGSIHFLLDKKLSQGLKYYHKSLNYFIDNQVEDLDLLSSLYNNLGLAYKNLGEYDSAILFYEKSTSINEKEGLKHKMITSYINLSRLNTVMGNSHKAISYASMCLDLGKKIKDRKSILDGYSALGDAYLRPMAHKSARVYLEKALALSLELTGTESSDTNYTYGLLARCLMESGEYDLSKKYNNIYLNYLKGIYGEKHPKLTPVFYSMSRAHFLEENYDSTKYFLNKSMEGLDKNTTTYNSWEFEVNIKLGEMYHARGEFDSALFHLDIAKDLYAHDSLRNMRSFTAIAHNYGKRGELTKSLSYFQQALRLIRPELDKIGNPQLQDIVYPKWVLDILTEKAILLRRLSQQDGNSKMQFLKTALSTYQLSDSLIINSQTLYKLDDDALQFNNSRHEVYKGAVEVCYELYQKTKEQKYFDLAFYFSERSKSWVLLKALNNQRAISFGGISDSLISKGEELKSRIKFYQTKERKLGDNEGVEAKKIREKLFDLNDEYYQFISSLEKNYPAYFNMKYNARLLTPGEVKTHLGKEKLIQYVSTQSNGIYVLILGSNDQAFIRIQKPKEFDQWANDFKELITNRQNKLYTKVGYNLYQSLLAPIADQINDVEEVIIVPDGNLWHINFDLLLTDEVKDADFSSWPYLIRSFAISYANSANLLFSNTSKTINAEANKCLAFSYTDSAEFDTSQALSFNTVRNKKGDLPGSRREITNIARHVPGIYYFGSAANERNFKKVSSDYSILHLALHGEIEDDNPNLSRLYFSQVDKDSLEDNYLHTYELYDMELNADLAVLSACNTGVGRLVQGEGIMSLGRAFQYAGVKSIVLSDWEVPDNTAPLLMEYFYTNLKQGMTKSVALKEAKLKYLESERLYENAPYYWGNFRVIGDDSSLYSADNRRHAPLVAILVAIAFALIWYITEKWNSRKAS